VPTLPLIAGGRSFGGRMTSQAQAEEPLGGVHGLAFLGFPLHPAGRPSDSRAEHLSRVQIPLLFVQGTRDALAERALLEALLAHLGPRASVSWLEDADHSFHVRARSGRNDLQVMSAVLDSLCEWLKGLL
jgi:predicted alpha/beta-hydrolase family hydrolase